MMKASVNMKNTVNQHSKVRTIILHGRTKAYLSVLPLQDGVMFCHRIYYSLSTAEAFLRFASRFFVRPAMYSATGSVARIFSQRWTSRRAAAIDSP